jgi:glycosyltransferase involved in cell wall biosynthesis
MLFEMQRMIQAGGYHVVDAHNVQSILWGMWAGQLAGAKQRIATIHSDFAAEYPGMKGKFYAGMLSAALPAITHTINVTDELQQQAAKRRGAQQNTLIPNAVPVPLNPLETRRNDLVAEWGFADSDRVIGVVGRLVSVKGHRYLIEAFEQLDDVPHVKLVIVGSGTLEPELKALVREKNLGDRVVFTGFRRDIPLIMQNLDCLCVPSLSEALPYVILEAASYARPLVVTRVGGLNTLLKDNQTALMVPPKNPDELAQAIRKLVYDTHLAMQLGKNAFNMVKKRFSVERMIADTLRVYDGT